MKTILFQYESPLGTFWIHPEPAGRVQLRIDGTRLKTYPSAKAAARDVAAHSTGWETWDSMPETKAPSTLARWKRGPGTKVSSKRKAERKNSEIVSDIPVDDNLHFEV